MNDTKIIPHGELLEHDVKMELYIGGKLVNSINETGSAIFMDKDTLLIVKKVYESQLALVDYFLNAYNLPQ